MKITALTGKLVQTNFHTQNAWNETTYNNLPQLININGTIYEKMTYIKETRTSIYSRTGEEEVIGFVISKEEGGK